MNAHQFDTITRALAARTTRRSTLGMAAGLGVAGLSGSSSSWFRQAWAQTVDKPVVVGKPKLVFDVDTARVSVTCSTAVACDIEYGTTKKFGKVAHSDEIGIEHEIEFGPLTVGQRYYVRFVFIVGETETRTKTQKFVFTGCSEPNVVCGGQCMAPCPGGLAFDESTCTCICPPGFASCDDVGENGCETDITTTSNCLACGNQCADGNACTEDICDPVSGCASLPLADGTPCSAAGVCLDGVCTNCLPGETCAGDTDCCDDEVCCDGTCVARATLQSDPANCGTCGNLCAANACEDAICDQGTCYTVNAANDSSCTPDDPCRANGVCSDGECTGVPVADGQPCGEGGSCLDGTCAECAPGAPCSADGSCCGDLECCNGHCLPPGAFETDPLNCGGCGNACPAGPCEDPICTNGVCGVESKADGEMCVDGNDCLEYRHCMGGECMGSPVEDGLPCGSTGTCHQGTCEDCISGGICSDDSDCCSDELCCEGTCLSVDSLNDDPGNCGACGFICESDDPCQPAACQNGVCGTVNADDGTSCSEDGLICLDGECGPTMQFSTSERGVLFQDDFESGGLGNWSSSARMVVQQTLFAAGENAARATGARTTAYARKVLSTPQNNLYFRTRFRIVSQGANSVYLLRAYKSSSFPLNSVFVDKYGRLSTHNGVTGAILTSKTVIARNVWYELELRTKVVGTKSLSWVWLDGVRIDSISKTTDLGTSPVTQIQIGDNVAKRTFDVVFDDVAACAGTFCPDPPPYERGYSNAPGADSGVLLRNYTFKGGPVRWEMLAYKPRQCVVGTTVQDWSWGQIRIDDPGEYEHWDIFPTLNYSIHKFSTRTEWAVVELNRAATVGIVWRGGSQIPPWLSSWTKRGSITISGKQFPVYVGSAKAGTLKLGAVYEPGHPDAARQIHRDTYWVLLAETDGLPSPPPAVPSGNTNPVPNATCPAWVHDAYVKTGPDGAAYASWHQQIDARYWCYHRHEHGTNPANFGSSVSELFGYAAAKHGMVEPHAGFKLRVFDDTAGRRWLLGLHMGTGGRKRACQRFHTVMIAVKDIASGTLLADIQFMGDFGRALTNGERLPYTPVDCPDQADAPTSEDSWGEREIPTGDRSGYESWTPDYRKTVFGLITRPSFKTDDPIIVCNSRNCDADHVRDPEEMGARHKMSLRNDADIPFGIDTSKAIRTGTFYTDPMGRELRNQSDPDAVRQYLAAGVKASATISGGHCFDVEGWGKLLQCGPEYTGFGDTAERENALLKPN